MRDLSAWQNLTLRMAASLASGGDGGASLLILIYHRVLEVPDPLLPNEPDAAAFQAQLKVLARNFNVLPLQEAATRLQAGTLPRRALCITFDDGYANNLLVAAPLLVEAGVPATVFVAPGFLDGGRMFNDSVIEAIRRARPGLNLPEFGLTDDCLASDAARVHTCSRILQQLKFLDPAERLRRVERLAEAVGRPLPTDLMLTTGQLQSLHRTGIEVGAHTMRHPILCSVPDEEAATEIARSRATLESLLQAPVRSFAYPNGMPGRDYAARHVEMVRKAGFTVAVSTAWGASCRQTDTLQLPRVAPWDRTALRYGLRLARAYRQRRFTVAA